MEINTWYNQKISYDQFGGKLRTSEYSFNIDGRREQGFRTLPNMAENIVDIYRTVRERVRLNNGIGIEDFVDIEPNSTQEIKFTTEGRRLNESEWSELKDLIFEGIRK